MIDIIDYLDKTSLEKFLLKLKNRNLEQTDGVENAVRAIVDDIRKRGDCALIEYTEKFDKIKLETLEISNAKRLESYAAVSSGLISALEKAKSNIEKYHMKQVSRSWHTFEGDGVILGQQIRPLERVGIYVPGGTASYPSTVLMNAVPAKIAGVKEIIMFTPPPVSDIILAAAHLAGVTQIYQAGGAQAIAALAYGTESIKPVDKIVGPGNIYVAAAKKLVYGTVDIDSIAGPSEILIIADEKSNPAYIAADLMSQAEHDILASSVLLCTTRTLVEKVILELESQIETLSRKDIIKTSLKNYGAIIIMPDIKTALDLSNFIAPEHLEIMTDDAINYLGEIRNAGSVFLGQYSPEPLGDYYAGPNHVLPTNGTARFSSPLSVDDFIKKSSFLSYTKEALLKASDDIINLAGAEKLTAHANSVRQRVL